MESRQGGRHRRTFMLIQGGAGEEAEKSEPVRRRPASDSALTGVDRQAAFDPTPIYNATLAETALDDQYAKQLAGEFLGIPADQMPDRPEVLLGRVADLQTLANDPNVSNAAFMSERSRRAAEVAGRLGMHEQQPGLRIVPPLPPDDVLK